MDQKQYSAKQIRQQPYRKDLLPLVEKENLTDDINLSGPLNNDSKLTLQEKLH